MIKEARLAELLEKTNAILDKKIEMKAEVEQMKKIIALEEDRRKARRRHDSDERIKNIILGSKQ